MTWKYDKTESTYSAVFPQSRGTIVVEGDEFAADDNGKVIESCEFLPLLEGRFYHFELNGEARLSAKSSFVRKAGRHGSIAPGTAVGYGRLYLEGAESPELALGVEVASDVVTYKKDYQDLLRQLTEDIADLHMQCTSCVAGLGKIDQHKAAKNDIQQLFFLLGLVGNADFDTAIRQIVERPQVQLVEIENESDVRSLTRLGRNELRQFVSGSRRVELPSRFRGAYAGLRTVPERILSSRRIESVDTLENRFVKYALNLFLERLQLFKRHLELKKKDDSSMTVEVDLDAAIRLLSRWTSHEFFKGVGPLLRMPTSSVVLQRREGYREVLRKWLQFQAGIELAWKPGEDIYATNQRKMSALYEYWCFFRLLKIVGKLFGVSTAEIADKMIGKSEDGLSLMLKAGHSITLDGTFDSGRTGARFRRLAVEYSYNRTFSAKGKNAPSWTLPMRPDYTLAFRPLGMNAEEAIANDLVTYVHFDAKYKAKDLSDSLSQINAATEEGENVEEASANEKQVEKDVKRVDILKMHAYRDAIHRTGGAYVLYPGTMKHIRRENGEILPGLGAFTLSPSNDSSEEIRGFLSSVAKHLCDRITRWENFTYREYQIYRQSRADFVSDQIRAENLLIPEYDEAEIRDGRRINPNALTSARYIDANCFFSVELEQAYASLKWAYEANVFALRKSHWEKLGKPSAEKISLISVFWHPPVNLIVQRYVKEMQGWELGARYSSYPFNLRTSRLLDEVFLVWEVRVVDAETFERRMKKQGDS